jgi:hypothetical protein
MEPRSLAVLNVMRWPWHAGEDWVLFLEEFSALDADALRGQTRLS